MAFKSEGISSKSISSVSSGWPLSVISMAIPFSLRPVLASLISLHLTDKIPVLADKEPISVVALMMTVAMLVSKDSSLVAGATGQVFATWA